MIMGNGIFAAIVDRRRIGYVGLIVFQPVLNRTVVLLNLSRANGYIATVVDDIMPVVLEDLLRLHIFCINHQAAGFAVETMHHVCRTLLARLFEIVVEDALHIQRRVSASHRKNALSLLYYDEPTVLIHYLHPTAFEPLLVAFRLAHRNLHAFLKREIKLRHRLAVHLDAPALQRRLDFRLRLWHIRQ